MTYDERTKKNVINLYPAFGLILLDVYDRVFMQTQKQMSLVEGYRTFGRQAELYAEGRTTVGPHPTTEKPFGNIVTKAGPGQTIHNYALAADSCFKEGDGYTHMPWDVFDQTCEDLGLKTGAQWPSLGDKDHCEQTWGMTLQDLLSFYKTGGLTLVFDRVDKLREVTPDKTHVVLKQELLSRIGG